MNGLVANSAHCVSYMLKRLLARLHDDPLWMPMAVAIVMGTAVTNAVASDPGSSYAGNLGVAAAEGALGANDNRKSTERLREGTRLIDTPGTFVSLGADSVTFAPSGGKDAYRVLENLALQRVSQQLDENRDPRQWIVSGLITEFRGSNYLLVTKAVVQLQDGDSVSEK